MLFNVITNDDWELKLSTYQQACIILALLDGITIFVELDNHCHFHYLVDLVDLDRM